MKVDDEYYYYQNDHLGTPQKLTAGNGEVAWSAKYNSFGAAEVDPASAVENNLRFPGQYADTETGLYYNHFRYYGPEIGRYLKPDPIGFEGGINHFIYTENSPTNFSDPLGMDTWSGAGDTVGGFLLFGGTSTTYGFVTNWKTGEKCYTENICYNIGAGLTGSVTANSIWIVNGPKCGRDLAGVSIGAGVEGGLGAYIATGPIGSAGISEDGTVEINPGAGIGVGLAIYASHCTTKVMSCKNSPCECIGD